MQEDYAQHHRDQRVNEISQGHINCVTAGRCHHVDKPVRADEERCRRQHQHDAAVLESAAEVSGCPQNRQQQGAEDEGEDYTRHDNLNRSRRSHHHKIQGEQAPNKVGADDGDKPVAGGVLLCF